MCDVKENESKCESKLLISLLEDKNFNGVYRSVDLLARKVSHAKVQRNMNTSGVSTSNYTLASIYFYVRREIPLKYI